MLLPGRTFAAMPPGARRPAPDGAPPTADATTAALDGSRLLTDERFAKLAVERAQKEGASYADARLVLWRRERVSSKC